MGVEMKTIAIAIFAITQLWMTTPAQAANELGALQAALDARNEFVTALEQQDFAQVTHNSMDGAVQLLAEQIRTEYKDAKMAQKVLQAWKADEANFFMLSLNDLGDHAPLLPQLEDALNQFADKYGTIIFSLPIVQDIRTLNFAIPVVFHPKGDWQSAEYDNRIEYRKHFIPFANIVTYYGVLIACNYYTSQSPQPDLKKICKPAAEKLKFVMGRYIAAPISDWIFKQNNKNYQVSTQARVYNTAEELRAAIQQ